MLIVSNFKNYHGYIQEQAEDLFNDYKVDFFKELEDGDIDVYEHFDEAVHSWVDNDFTYIDLHDCAYILESSDNVADDSGLWEGQEPLRAVETMAFFTYRTDLMEALKEVVKEGLEDLKREMEDKMEDLEQDQNRNKDKLAELQTNLEEIEDEEDEESLSKYSQLEEEIDELETDIDLADEKISEIQDTIDNIVDTIDNI
jgi:predicted ribosome quality control (RQC) complex YloA/Tae2 family protein